jgi:hypothetical protein
MAQKTPCAIDDCPTHGVLMEQPINAPLGNGASMAQMTQWSTSPLEEEKRTAKANGDVVAWVLFVAAAGGGSGMTASQWGLGILISFSALMAGIWFNWGQHRLKVYRLKRAAFDAFLAYGPAVPNEQLDLRLPAGSQVMVQIRIRPRLQYRQIEILFGCKGSKDARPIPLRVENRFIKAGATRVQSPGTNPNHYIDHDDHYHIVQTMDRSPPNTQALEFVVQTKGPGRFPIALGVITDIGEANPKWELFLTVVDQPVPDAHVVTE